MLQQHYLVRGQYATRSTTPLPKPEAVHLPTTQSAAAPYFANYVTDQLVQKFHTARVYGGGLRVKTTIDLEMQKIARDAIAKVLPPTSGPTAALVALDAHTGAVLAMVGGRNYHKSQFNLATQGERQPGSSFKPFVLAAALKSGISPSTTLVSQPVTIDAGGRLWEVNNYEGDYNRPDRPAAGDRVLRQLGLRAADGHRRAAERRATPRSRSGSRRRSTATSRSASAASRRRRSTWRAPTPRSRTAASGSTARSSATQPRAVELPRGRDGNCKKDNAIDAQPVLEDWQAATVNELLQGVVRYGTGKAARAPRLPRRRQDRARPRTTATPGSSATRPISSPPSGSAIPTSSADDDRVPRPPGRRRHVPGADLEGVHGEGARPEHLPPSRSRRPTPYASPVTVVFRGGLLSATTASATTRCSSQFFSGSGRPRSRRASRTRSRSPTWSAGRSPTRRRGCRAAADAGVIYSPAHEPRSSASSSSSSREGHRVCVRHDHPGPSEVAARRRPAVVGLPLDARAAKPARLKLDVGDRRLRRKVSGSRSRRAGPRRRRGCGSRCRSP